VSTIRILLILIQKPIFLPCDAMVYAVVVCLSMCLFVTLQYYIKTAKRRIIQIMPDDSLQNLVF